MVGPVVGPAPGRAGCSRRRRARSARRRSRPAPGCRRAAPARRRSPGPRGSTSARKASRSRSSTACARRSRTARTALSRPVGASAPAGPSPPPPAGSSRPATTTPRGDQAGDQQQDHQHAPAGRRRGGRLRRDAGVVLRCCRCSAPVPRSGVCRLLLGRHRLVPVPVDMRPSYPDPAPASLRDRDPGGDGRAGAAEVAALVRDLRAGLAAAADPAAAPAMQAYMKSDAPLLRRHAPGCRAVFRACLAAHPLPDRAAWLAAVERLWDEATHREERYAALALSRDRRYADHRDTRRAAALPAPPGDRRLVGRGRRRGRPPGRTAAARPPGGAGPVVRAWATDEDRWLRRTAVIAQLLAKDRTDLDLLTAAIDANLDDRDFFLRKAIGWALRQYARTDPDWVRAFVAEHGDRLSPLSRREALKHLGPLGGPACTAAAQQWADELAAWRIDPAILAAAPESPYGFPPALFAPRDDVESPLLDLARAALPPGGTVLDVGAGAGAGSLGLGRPVGRLHAVDSQPSMLRALEATAAERGVAVTTYDGAWPDGRRRGPGLRRRRVLPRGLQRARPGAVRDGADRARPPAGRGRADRHPPVGAAGADVGGGPRAVEAARADRRAGGGGAARGRHRAGGDRGGARPGGAHRRAARGVGRLHPPAAVPAARAARRGRGADGPAPARSRGARSSCPGRARAAG